MGLPMNHPRIVEEVKAINQNIGLAHLHSIPNPHTKTVSTEGKLVTFKWCKQCRRWRSGLKAHLTEEHKKKTTTEQQHNGNTLHHQATGINFGLFTGETYLDDDGTSQKGFLETFYSYHSPVDEDQNKSNEENKQAHPKELAGQW